MKYLFIGEDWQRSRRFLKMMSTYQIGREHISCSRGWEALVLVEQEKPDVIIIDCISPGPGTLNAVPELKKLMPEGIILAFLEDTLDNVSQAIEQLGMDGFLLNSGNEEQLAARLREAVEVRRKAVAPDKAAIKHAWHAVIENLPVLAVALDSANNFTFWNSECVHATGYAAQEILHNPGAWQKLFPDERMRHRAQLLLARPSLGNESGELTVSCRDGTEKTIYWHNVTRRMNIADWQGCAIGIDISREKNYREKLEYFCRHDPLTGVYNRAYFQQELERLQQEGFCPVTILVSDLDGLKLVNDSMGYAQGDQLLRTFAGLLKKCLRHSDLLARVGDSEFCAIVRGVGAGKGNNLINRVRRELKAYHDKQADLPLEVSLGIAVAEDPKKPLVEIFQKAENLMFRDKLFRSVGTRNRLVQTLLAALAEKDFITEGHTARLKECCFALGERLALSHQHLTDLVLLTQMHDLGKVAIPDHILFKEGPLTKSEWEIMRRHPIKGYHIACASPELKSIADLILKHHEHWDGGGYPIGLRGANIPIECRILAIADAYDAMTHNRPYRTARSKQEAMEELKRCAGTQFDPYLVEVFLSLLEDDCPDSHC